MPVEPAEVVRSFFERMQARRWREAELLLDERVHVEYTATGERFDGPAFLAMNEAYDEGWELDVVEVIAAADRVAAQVVVHHGEATHWCAGFYTVRDGTIAAGVEHWVMQGSEAAPAWRQRFTSP